MTRPDPATADEAPPPPRDSAALRWFGAVAAIASFVALTVPVLLWPDDDAQPLASLVLGLVVAAPLAWAWWAPIPAIGLVGAGLVVAALTGVRVTPFVSDAGPALGVAAFVCGVRLPRRTGALVVGVAATAVTIAELVALVLRPEHDQDLVQLLLAAGGWLVGDVVRTRRALRAELGAQEVRRVAEAEARIRAEERLRLSRDVHDVVSHTLSLVAVRAGVGRLLLDSDPDEARAALRTIEEVSRRALDELRGVLAGMGDVPDGSVPRRVAPEPSLDDLPALVASVADSGLDVTLEVDGDATYERLLETAAYRVVQEALTNVVKHAPDARVRVMVRRVEPLSIVVRDDGAGSGALGAAPLVGSGLGLEGIRARVELHGGAADAGVTEDGGWRVAAVFGAESAAQPAGADDTGQRADRDG
jgi:signal transduction histidine kinase